MAVFCLFQELIEQQDDKPTDILVSPTRQNRGSSHTPTRDTPVHTPTSVKTPTTVGKTPTGAEKTPTGPGKTPTGAGKTPTSGGRTPRSRTRETRYDLHAGRQPMGACCIICILILREMCSIPCQSGENNAGYAPQ